MSKGCTCFTCTHPDLKEQFAYYQGYVDACRWFLNWAKEHNIPEGHISNDDLPGIVAQMKYNHDESDCYRLEIKEILDAKNSENSITPEKLREMVADPRYWRDEDPEICRKIREGFRKLYGEQQ